MPFASAAQEYYMMINHPEIWREWVQKYGHHPGFKALVRKKKRNKPKRAAKRRRVTKGKQRKHNTKRRRKKKR